MNYANEVILQGVIVGKTVTPRAVVLTINTGNATKIPNYPKVVFFGDLRDEVVKKYKKGNRVRVVGNIQSSAKTEKNKDRSLINIFAEGIEPAKTIMASTFDVTDHKAYIPFENTIQLAGHITKITPLTKNLLRVTVLTVKNNRRSFVSLAHYTDNAEKFIAEYKPKDAVFVIGNIQTSQKVMDGEKRSFQNYVATNFAKQN